MSAAPKISALESAVFVALVDRFVSALPPHYCAPNRRAAEALGDIRTALELLSGNLPSPKTIAGIDARIESAEKRIAKRIKANNRLNGADYG